MSMMRTYSSFDDMVWDRPNARVGDRVLVGSSMYIFGPGRTWHNVSDKDEPLARAKSELYASVEVMWEQLTGDEKQRFYEDRMDTHRHEVSMQAQQVGSGTDRLMAQLRDYRYEKGENKWQKK